MVLVCIPNEQGTEVPLVPGDSQASAEATKAAILAACIADSDLNPVADPAWPSRVDGINEDAPARANASCFLRIDIVDPTPVETSAALAILGGA